MYASETRAKSRFTQAHREARGGVDDEALGRRPDSFRDDSRLGRARLSAPGSDILVEMKQGRKG